MIAPHLKSAVPQDRPIRTERGGGPADLSAGRNMGALERAASLLIGGMLVGGAFTRPLPSMLLRGAIGGFLLYRGASGSCPLYHALHVTKLDASALAHPLRREIVVHRSATILGEPGDLHRRLSDPACLAELLPGGAASVELLPGRAGKRIEWRSLPGTVPAAAGRIDLVEAPPGRGTELHVTVRVRPKAGVVGATAALVRGDAPDSVLAKGLRALKQRFEVGEIATGGMRAAGDGAEGGPR